MYQLLRGMKILDLTRLLPGGYATQLLADLGAEVLKVEDPWQGDYIRWMPPFIPGTRDSAFYWALNRNKQSVRINLKSAEGKETFLRLIKEYSIVIEGFRPGVMDGLGLSYEKMRESHPALILCSISGYGQDGPYRLRSGHDLNYLAIAGALGLTGQAGGPPVPPSLQVADIGGGALLAIVGILTAYIAREKDGRGRHIDVSMLDGALSWMGLPFAQLAAGDPALKRGEGPLTGGDVCYAVYETRDGRYMSLGALEPKFWQAFCAAVGRPDLAEKQFAREPAVRAEVERIFLERTQKEWTELLAPLDVCCEPVLEPQDVPEHPQVKARRSFLALQHPEAGEIKVPANPLRFRGEKELPDRIPPDFG